MTTQATKKTRSIAQTITGYWKGDAIHHTGEIVKLDGGLFEKAVLLEGARQGETILVVLAGDTNGKIGRI